LQHNTSISVRRCVFKLQGQNHFLRYLRHAFRIQAIRKFFKPSFGYGMKVVCLDKKGLCQIAFLIYKNPGRIFLIIANFNRGAHG